MEYVGMNVPAVYMPVRLSWRNEVLLIPSCRSVRAHTSEKLAKEGKCSSWGTFSSIEVRQ